MLQVLIFLFFSAFDVSFTGLLEEMTDPFAHALWPANEYVCRQASSYSRESVTPATAEEDGRYRPESGRDWAKGWFDNHDFNNYIREEPCKDGRTQYVMFEDYGPGAIVRFWAAWGGYCDEVGGDYIVYIDGSDTPVIRMPIRELVGGTGLVAYPFSYVAPAKTENLTWLGRNLTLPIPYGKSCKVCYMPCDESVRAQDHGHYYQINYRSYAPGTKVESFDEQTVTKFAKDIYACGVRLIGDKSLQSDDISKAGGCTIAPGRSKSLTLKGERCITSLSVQLAADAAPDALKKTVLRMTFDGEETVECPLGNFFGIGPLKLSHSTFYVRTSSDGMMTAYWAMPFARKAEVTLENTSQTVLKVNVFQTTSRNFAWDPERSMHFHAWWHETRNLESQVKRDYNYVSIEGKGRYIADGLEIYNYHPDYQGDSWWGEGDEKIFVDGEAFPSHFGTGTEDYYSYAYCRPQPFCYPSISQPQGDGNKKPGLSVNNRYRLLDDIPFGKSLDFYMEIWHAYYSPMDYAPATFWYAFPGCRWGSSQTPKSSR